MSHAKHRPRQRPLIPKRSLSASLLAVLLSMTSALPAARAETSAPLWERLVNSRLQPRLGDWLLNPTLDSESVRRLESASPGAVPTNESGELSLAQVDRFIHLAEIIYPGLTFVFLGRDTAPLANAVNLRLALRGESGRVINVPLSGASVNAMSESELVEFLAQQGVRPHLGEDVPPYILIDRTEYHRSPEHSSQVTKIVSAFYKAFDALGFSPDDFARKINLLSVRASYTPSTTLMHVQDDGAANLFRSSGVGRKMNRYRTDGATNLLVPMTAAWLDVPAPLLDRGDLEWHETFSKPLRPANDPTGPLQTVVTNEAPPTFLDLQKRQRALALGWAMLKTSVADEHASSVTPFLAPILKEDGNIGEIDWNRFLNVVSDPRRDPESRLRYLTWYLGLGRDSEGGSWLVESVLEKLGASQSELGEIREKAFNPALREGTAFQWATAEMIVMRQFLQSLGDIDWERNSLAQKALDRFAECVDRWVALETAGGKELRNDRIQFLQNILAAGGPKSRWYQAYFRRMDGRLHRELKRLEETASTVSRRERQKLTAAENVLNAQTTRPGPIFQLNSYLKAMTGLVVFLDATVGALDIYSVTNHGFTDLGLLAVATAPVALGNFNLVQAYYNSGFFNHVRTGLDRLRIRIQDKLLAGKTAGSGAAGVLENLENGRAKGLKACLMSLQR